MMKKNNNYKYSAIFEGKIDQHIFNTLKNNIIRSSNLSLCKRHGSKNNEGTININKIKKNICCTQIIIMDEDNVQNINDYINRRNNSNLIIISSPAIEIVLYCIFSIPNKNDDIKSIISKLNKKASSYFKKKYKYEKDINCVNEILKIINDTKKYNSWKKNLNKLNENNTNNFIDLLEFIEKFKRK